MNFSFNSDQLLIAETAQTYLSAVSDSGAIRMAMQSESGFDTKIWNQLNAEMGWQLTHIPEQYEGLGLGFVELAILFEAMGQNLFCSPFFSTSALGINALQLAGTDAQKQSGLTSIATEGSRYALAYMGKNRLVGADAVALRYKENADGVTLKGSCHYVIDGHTADTLIVAARQENSSGKDDIALFHVPAQTQGVTRTWTPSMDQTRKLASIEFDQVSLGEESVMQRPGEAGVLLEQILALASICLAAEQLGVADKSLSLTVDYIQERKQFGRVVGSFQAMKHKAADMMTKVEAARSAVYYAACIADEFMHGNPLGNDLQEAASIAKAVSCDAAFFNAGCALQMHGGVGFTWEYDVHLYFKRAKAAQVSFGDSAWHKERLAQTLLGEIACS